MMQGVLMGIYIATLIAMVTTLIDAGGIVGATAVNIMNSDADMAEMEHVSLIAMASILMNATVNVGVIVAMDMSLHAQQMEENAGLYLSQT